MSNVGEIKGDESVTDGQTTTVLGKRPITIDRRRKEMKPCYCGAKYCTGYLPFSAFDN